jgi:acylphosphatase
MPTKHLLIKGKVQGVFYRASAKEAAEKLGVSGWIRNTDEGAVEAMASGTEAQVQEFIRWCWQGPARAEVKQVAVQDMSDEQFTGFRILRG